MSSYYSLLERGASLPLLLASLVLAIGGTAALLFSLRERRSARQAACAHALACFALFVFLLNSYDIVCFPQTEGASIDGTAFPYSLPWPVFAALEALSASVLAFSFRNFRSYRAGTVTPDTIHRAVDLLPEGICVSSQDGTALLSNLTMDRLCRELTGGRLSDVRTLLSRREAEGEDQGGKRLMRTPGGEVWLFSSGTITEDGAEYGRTSAVNVTERYRITEELRAKNARLLDIRRRMKEASELSAEMFVKQEEASARIALHNELGQVLLMGRHYIEHPESADASAVAMITSQMNRFLLGENRDAAQDGIPGSGRTDGSAGAEHEACKSAEDELREAVRMAGSIGVSVEISGLDPVTGYVCGHPVDREALSILSEAIRECAANAVKHAGADSISAVLRPEGADGFEATITNSGRPPEGPIDESGGLLSLRRRVEAAGGTMSVQSSPAFSLTMTFASPCRDGSTCE